MSQAEGSTERSSESRFGARWHVLLATEGFFADRSPAVVWVVALTTVAVVFGVDNVTGPRLSLSLFYMLPVGLVTWRLGRGGGAVMAALAAAAWMASDLITDAYGSDPVPFYWNAAVRLGMLLVVANLLANVHGSMRAGRDLADEATTAAQELRALNDVKDTLLHAVSHDLRGSIAAIVGSAQSLERRSTLGLDRGDEDVLIDGILQSGRKLNRMVGDLLDLERLERGMVEPDRVPTDLVALVDRVVSEAVYAEDHPIRVEAFERLEMDVDAGQVERIVENLLVNAVKHTPMRTAVRVHVERCDGGALLRVEDEGPGVPDDMKVEVFEPFRQGPDARSGAGIGLSLVSRFAELHGGRVWVEDRPGGGAAFKVFLPGPTRTVTPRARSAASA